MCTPQYASVGTSTGRASRSRSAWGPAGAGSPRPPLAGSWQCGQRGRVIDTVAPSPRGCAGSPRGSTSEPTAGRRGDVGHRADGRARTTARPHESCARVHRAAALRTARPLEQSPLAGHALQRAGPEIGEADARADHEVGHGAGHEHAARLGVRHHARGDVHRDARDLSVLELHFPCADPPGRRCRATPPPSISDAHRTARAGPSKIARKPSPVVAISRPRARGARARARRGRP